MNYHNLASKKSQYPKELGIKYENIAKIAYD
jgi:hypothetical protein